MYGVIGICQTSPSYVMEHLSRICDDKITMMLVGDSGAKKGFKILLYPSLTHLVHDLDQQASINAVALLFDTPENLKRVGAQFTEDPEEYMPDAVDITELKRTVLACLERKKHVEYRLTDINILNELIEDRQRGKILHHYTKLVYSHTGTRREDLKSLLLRFLFGDIKVQTFMDEIAAFTKRDQALSYFVKLWDFIDKEGQPLINALRHMKKRRFAATINVAQVSREFKADEYEINFLSKSYQDMLRKQDEVKGTARK